MSRPVSEIQTPEDVLQLGHPGLRTVSEPVDDLNCSEFRDQSRALQRVLEAFRRQHGFGRAIAAPQVGFARRFIAVNFGDGPELVINPQVTWKSEETFTMWTTV